MRKPFLKKKNFLPSSLLSSGAAAQVNKNGSCASHKSRFSVAWATFICVKSFTSVYITDRKAYNVIAKV